MSKHENIAAASEATASVELVPLANLYLHPDNPRQEADAEGIEALAESLAVCGLMQNLGGIREEDGRVGVIFGGRRLRALQIAVEKNPALAVVPVRIAPDQLTALAWATAENTARQDMTPAQEIRAYGKMRDSGAPVGSIARAFAVQENHVYRRLALADLPAPVLKALEEKQISLGQAAAFTVANDEKLALEVLELARGGSLSEARIKSLLQPQSINSTDRRARFVGLAAYTAAGGTLTQDLFADESEALLHDQDLLDRLFAERLEDEATKLVEAEGWKWVSTFQDSYVPWDYTDKNKLAKLYAECGELSDAEADELQTLEDLQQGEELDDAGAVRLAELTAKTEARFTEAQKALAGGLVHVNHSGKLCSTMGMVKPEDAGAAIEAGLLAPNQHEAKAEEPKSLYSQKLVADMKALRLASVQGALLGKPELVLDLLAFAVSGEAKAGIFDIRFGTPNNAPSVDAGAEIDPRLSHKEEGIDRDSGADAFLAFQELGKKHRNAVLTAGLARVLNYGCNYGGQKDTSLFTHIEEDAKAELRSIWTPNKANFFGRVSGPYLQDLLTDLLSAQPTDDRLQAFAKLKTTEKAETMERLFSDADTRKLYRVTPEQAERIAAWHPDCI